MPNWTPQQEQAIFEKGKNLLVSAAAGSGKTAVLSARAVEFVKAGGSLSRLLIVTFTRAAAAEMKKRISARLSDEYHLQPSAHLKKERLGVSGARISTIDSFYASLLRQNFQKAGISPDFTVISSSEYESVSSAVMEKLLEERFSDYGKGFGDLLALLGGEQNSEAVSEAVRTLYGYLRSVPFPRQWMQRQLEKYRDPSYYIREACRLESGMLKEIRDVFRSVLDSGCFSGKGEATVREEYGLISRLLESLEAGDWDGACRELEEKPLSTAARTSKDDPEQQRYKVFRAQLKKYCEQEIFRIRTSDVTEEAERQLPQIEAFFAFVTDYSEELDRRFRRLGRFPFDFISQTALGLLISDYDHDTGAFVRTPLAEELADSVDEIMIDEYQDVNDVQDLTFRAITRTEGNVFAVGDVKQSIYRFRRANPRNFLRRMREDSLISLNRNFRSRKGILDFINFLFEGLFSDYLCDMTYTDSESLVCGRTGTEDKPEEPPVELLLADSETSAERKDTDERLAEEAAVTAVRIRELLRNGRIPAEEGGERMIRPGDIAILLRNTSGGRAVCFEKTLRDAGLPVSATGKGSFWDSVEVGVVSALLNIIDNPYDDLSFFAVMFSDLYSFSADLIARIRIGSREDGKGRPFYDACRDYAEKTGNEKCRKLLDDLERYHLLSRSFSPERLIRQIYTDTGFPDRVSCLEEGRVRRENLMAFYNFAVARSKNTAVGLHSFLTVAAAARENAEKRDEEEASPDCIRIMTVHASKGLEFPVCFLACIDGKLNTDDITKGNLFSDEKLGFSAYLRDREMRYQMTTFPREVMRLNEKRNFIAEEMRVLYVALTRAREKLILVTSADKLGKLEEEATLSGEKTVPAAYYLLKGEIRLLHFLCPRLACCSCLELLRNGESGVCADGTGISVRFMTERPETVELQAEEKIRLTDPELSQRLQPGRETVLSEVPAKLSVTELIKGFYRDGDEKELIRPEVTVRKPAFLSARSLTAAQKGTALHSFFRYADLATDPAAELRRLVDGGYLTPEEGACIDLGKVGSFRTGKIYEMMQTADEVRKEEEFIVSLPASLYDRRVTDGSTFLVQGAIDLLLIRNGEAVIVDYKTDFASEEELLDRYLKQLYLYKLAAEPITGLPVTGLWIWSFHLSEAIDCLPHLPALTE